MKSKLEWKGNATTQPGADKASHTAFPFTERIKSGFFSRSHNVGRLNSSEIRSQINCNGSKCLADLQRRAAALCRPLRPKRTHGTGPPPSLKPPALLLILDFFFLLSNGKIVKMPRGSNLYLFEKFLKECDKVFHRACVAGGGGPVDLVKICLVQEDQTLRSSAEVLLTDG